MKNQLDRIERKLDELKLLVTTKDKYILKNGILIPTPKQETEPPWARMYKEETEPLLGTNKWEQMYLGSFPPMRREDFPPLDREHYPKPHGSNSSRSSDPERRIIQK